MSSSSKGTSKHGHRVRQKSGLNRAILDQGWAEFRRQLEYKTQWRGHMLLAVPAHHTSQTCPCCRHVAPANRRTQAQFLCVACGHTAHADVVGAINILERGLALVSLSRGGLWPWSQDYDVTSLCEAGTRRSDVQEAAHA